MLQSQAPRAHFHGAPGLPGSSGCWGAQPLPTEQFAFAYNILGLHMRFHLQKGFHCFQKCFQRPHNKGYILPSPVHTIKSGSTLLTSERQFCIKKHREHTPGRSPGPP